MDWFVNDSIYPSLLLGIVASLIAAIFSAFAIWVYRRIRHLLREKGIDSELIMRLKSLYIMHLELYLYQRWPMNFSDEAYFSSSCFETYFRSLNLHHISISAKPPCDPPLTWCLYIGLLFSPDLQRSFVLSIYTVFDISDLLCEPRTNIPQIYRRISGPPLNQNIVPLSPASARDIQTINTYALWGT